MMICKQINEVKLFTQNKRKNKIAKHNELRKQADNNNKKKYYLQKIFLLLSSNMVLENNNKNYFKQNVETN